jgi:hypothetical protein
VTLETMQSAGVTTDRRFSTIGRRRIAAMQTFVSSKYRI